MNQQFMPLVEAERIADASAHGFTAAELQAMVFEPIKYVVPRIITEGLTILAGAPKIGKSWMALDIAKAVATGGTCLGSLECDQGNVLYLALEDNRRRLQSRMRKTALTDDAWPDALEFMTDCPRSNEGGLDRVTEWFRRVPYPRLVIVDVLATFKAVKGEKEALYDADYAAIKPLKDLAMANNFGLLVIHHTRKSKEQDDPFEKVSGSNGLNGAADTTLVLSRGSNGVTLYGRGRDIPELELAMKFEAESCKWHILGAAGDVLTSSERHKILDALREAGSAMSPSDLCAATGILTGNLRPLLFRMAKAGEIIKEGRGLYKLAEIMPGHSESDGGEYGL